jgi:hypothetical protein
LQTPYEPGIIDYRDVFLKQLFMGNVSTTMGIFDRLVEIVNKEYDRRIKRASNIIEYGMHHGHGHSQSHAPHAPHHASAAPHAPDNHDNEDDDDTVIANVPVGSRVHGGQRPYTETDEDHSV